MVSTKLQPRTLQRPWGHLRIWTAGRGRAVVAVHGLGGSGRYWQGLARQVGDRCTLIAPDLGGFGHSDKPNVAYDRDFHLDNLDAVITAFAQDNPVLVGHSLGGVLIALWAARHPDRVARLALAAAPFPSVARVPAHAGEETPGRHDRVRRIVEAGARRLWPVLAVAVRSRTFPREVVADYARQTRESYYGTLRALYWDAALVGAVEGLRQVNAPALIVSASDDRRVAMGDAAKWAALLRNAKVASTLGGHQLLLRGNFQPVADFVAG